MPDIKVLMADDDKDILEIMAKKVSAEGYLVVTASDGEEALDKIQKENPDIILLDLTMPKKNGFEVLKSLRENSALKWRPVIIVSGRNELQDIQQGFSYEADHYIAKPCKIEDILKAIRLMVNLIPQRKAQHDT